MRKGNKEWIKTFKHDELTAKDQNGDLSMLQTIFKHRLWNATSIVCVFPDDVCPYANIVPL